MAEETQEPRLKDAHAEICRDVGSAVMLAVNRYNATQFNNDSDNGAAITQIGLLLYGIGQWGCGRVVERTVIKEEQEAK